jgi:hypothetical protein
MYVLPNKLSPSASTDQKVTCPIQSQTFLVCLGICNSYFKSKLKKKNGTSLLFVSDYYEYKMNETNVAYRDFTTDATEKYI